MASSIMHLAVAYELAKRHEFKDFERLKFGVILPDAGEGQKGHLGTYRIDGTVENYFAAIGIDEATQKKIKEKLL